MPQGSILGVFLFNVSTDDLKDKEATNLAATEQDQDTGEIDEAFQPSTPTDTEAAVAFGTDLSPVRGRPGIPTRDGIFLPGAANER